MVKSFLLIIALFVMNCASDTVLIQKIKTGNTAYANQAIDSNSPEWNEGGEFSLTPLHYAAEYGHLELVKKLLDKGADINAKGGIYFATGGREGNETPLLLAIKYGHTEVAKYLVSKGANVNDRTYRKRSVTYMAWKYALMHSVQEKDKKQSLELLNYVNSLNTTLDSSRESLATEIVRGYVTFYSNTDVFKSYLSRNLNLNCCDRESAPLLFLSSSFKETDVKKRKLALELLDLILKTDIDLYLRHFTSDQSNRSGLLEIFEIKNEEAQKAKALIMAKFPNVEQPEPEWKTIPRNIVEGFGDLLFFWL
ncbi:ankyrin repeat domain-containing protein [Leptospira andrefontaineae]|uniref:Ankyrin repeat domain-containing protein n=1 Tax=Leptospira andrefontaineae TaxID=2484976 RepID=A0A4R9GY03_9LEPT|nr:ankyrin repeat domain-containing protein [Leptospira andrefontaineae]TGK36656.1 ankyrin repeat domain-containing protein [Leptospira andrefontaineae]